MDEEDTAARRALADRLKRECSRLDLQPEDLADKSGVHRSTAFNYLAGARVPDALVLARMQLQAKVDVLYVLTGERDLPAQLSAAEKELLQRYDSLPAKLRTFVDQALLLSHLAYSDRKRYHEEDEAVAQVSIKGKANKVGNVAGRDVTINAPPKKKGR